MDPKWHYAVVVGIDAYPAVGDLSGPRADALNFTEWLLQTGVPRDNLRLVLADAAAKFDQAATAIPTKQLVDDALLDLITKVRSDGGHEPANWELTRLYIYLAGHGVAPTGSEAAVLMANARRGKYSDCIGCSRYLTYFEDTRHFRELVFFADSCRTFSLSTRPQPPQIDFEPAYHPEVSTMIGFAADFGGLAYESDVPTQLDLCRLSSSRGHFTRALLEGLSGNAVDPESGEVNSTSLARYIRRRVQDLVPPHYTQQIPHLVADVSAPVVFARNCVVPRWQVRLHFPAGCSSEVLLRSAAEIARFRPVVNTWQLDLQDGLYEAVALDGTSFANRGLFSVRGASCDVHF